jgi:hypothetical protein
LAIASGMRPRPLLALASAAASARAAAAGAAGSGVVELRKAPLVDGGAAAAAGAGATGAAMDGNAADLSLRDASRSRATPTSAGRPGSSRVWIGRAQFAALGASKFGKTRTCGVRLLSAGGRAGVGQATGSGDSDMALALQARASIWMPSAAQMARRSRVGWRLRMRELLLV